MPRRRSVDRRTFLRAASASAAWVAQGASAAEPERTVMPQDQPRPNLVFVFADQMRAQATGYAGDPNVQTPNLDRLARESVNFTHTVSGCPVCSPYRASLLTGQYPLTHGVFLNDLCLRDEAVSIAEALGEAGYDTAYIGKWHLDGHGRSNFIPRERRQGFDFWKVLECTHDYNNSHYYGDTNEKLTWEGYDAIAQTREAQRYLEGRRGDKPFVLFLSWGPPHNPYQTAPEEYKRLYRAEDLVLRPNVPADHEASARRDLAGYYAHISAMDACIGDLLGTLRERGLEEDTIFVFTSDHGDMLGSQGQMRKQRPWDESILVPFLLRYPGALGREARRCDLLVSSPDVMPTLLGLCGTPIPETVEGKDFSGYLLGGERPDVPAALIACYAPFGEWVRAGGGKEYRGVRTHRYTYVRDLEGPWLLYENEKDPYQLENLCGRPELADVQEELERQLERLLREQRDEFSRGEEYVRKWGYEVDESGTVPYTS